MLLLVPTQSYAKTYIQTVEEKPPTQVQYQKITHYQDTDWGIGYSNIQKFWNKGFTGKGVKIAIIDTGIDYRHKDLRDNFVKGVSFIENKNFTDDNGHGTHVAGIIAGEDNNTGFVGVAPKAKLYIAKALDKNGYGNIEDLNESMKWSIKNNVDIINMSIGFTEEDFNTEGFTEFEGLVDEANKKGIVIVAAAGNDSNNQVDYPARFKNVIAVGSITNFDSELWKTRYTKSWFSNYGSKVEVTAPGSFIYSTYPMSIEPFLYPKYGYEMLSGTSMAAPYTSGFLAVLMNRYPNDNVRQLKNHLHYHTKDLGMPGRDKYYGYGVIRVR